MAKWEEVKEKLILVEGWARNGATDEMIMQNLGISRTTFYEYRKKYSAFAKALKNGKEVVDFAVENALLKKALAGDVTAMIFWLKNRQRDKWRDKQDHEITGKDGGPIETSVLTPEERQARINELIAKRGG